MNPCEASRQYQIAREHERRGHTELAGVVSAEDELAAAKAETARTREQLIDALVEQERAVLDRLVAEGGTSG